MMLISTGALTCAAPNPSLSLSLPGPGSPGCHALHAVPQRAARRGGGTEGQGGQRQQQRAPGSEYNLQRAKQSCCVSCCPSSALQRECVLLAVGTPILTVLPAAAAAACSMFCTSFLMPQAADRWLV